MRVGHVPPGIDVPMISLNDEQFAHAWEIAHKRMMAGKTSPPDSGVDPVRVDLIGTIAEVAVCLHYGESYLNQVTVYEKRPGAIPDIMHKGYRISVKGRDRWISPLDLIVPDYDLNSDIYLLVSVSVEGALCGLRGWIKKEKLQEYEPRGWQWDDDRPGASKPQKKRRYVPVEDLRPCKT